jgi:ATP-dependent Clp protease ATP-binding subunit ClpC
VVFHQLSEAEIVSIVDLMAARVERQLKNKDMGLELTDAAKILLAKKGYDPVLGARPLRRTIQREIEDTLSEKILFGEIQPGQIIVVDVEGDPNEPETAKFTFRGTEKLVPVEVPAGVAGTTDGDAAK